jgi:hypothetical protein
MALVYNGFLTHGLLAAYQAAARLNACLSEAARRFSEFRWPFSTSDLPDREFRWPISTSDLPDSERRSGWSRQSASAHLPGSVFDARYKGLTGHAARLDAAICRQKRLR